MYGIWLLYENILEQGYGTEHNTFRVFNDSNQTPSEQQKDAFWNALDGPRTVFPGVQIPRTSIDDPDRGSKYMSDQIRDFYRD
jgi:hypothetical protein